MKCTIPEIVWHAKDPVLSADIQKGFFKNSSGVYFWRIATGGADSHVVIWHLSFNKENVPSVMCVADLEQHQKAVNVVRFSPSGEFLASGDDEFVIRIWKCPEKLDIFLGEENENKEQWSCLKVLRGHIEDVLDVSWSSDSQFLVSGSVDNSVILWNVDKGKKIGILSDYKGFVQGVCFDPLSKYVVTLCADRYCRLIDIQNHNKLKTIHRVSKAKIPTPEGHAVHGKSIRLFHDDTFQSFFRRLTFSPDGLLIFVPSGIIEAVESNEKTCNCTIIFSRYSLKEPIAILPSYDEPTVAVRCCPLYFKLRENGPTPAVLLPYRIVFAVATQRSVLLYDTQQMAPVAVVSNIHYTRLTDATWSSDGKILMVSSTDGYCSIINFDDNELGDLYEGSVFPNSSIDLAKKSEDQDKENTPVKKLPVPFFETDANAVDIDISKNTASDNFKNNESTIKPVTVVVERMEVDTQQKEKDDPDVTEDFQLVLEDTVAETSGNPVKVTPPKTEKPTIINSRTPRRVQLITLSSPKRAKN